MNVLLSIKPEFAGKILTKEKQYEFRKSPFRQASRGDEVIMYASSPMQKIVGSFTFNRIIESTPEDLWNQFQAESGIDDADLFFDYFSNRETGFAIEIQNVSPFENPIDPYERFKLFRPPVSFAYMNGEYCFD